MVVTTALILASPQNSEPFHIEADSSDFTSRAILSQQLPGEEKWHPVAFYSKSLSLVERNYEIHDKEMLAIICTLKEWRHFLEGARYYTANEFSAEVSWLGKMAKLLSIFLFFSFSFLLSWTYYTEGSAGKCHITSVTQSRSHDRKSQRHITLMSHDESYDRCGKIVHRPCSSCISSIENLTGTLSSSLCQTLNKETVGLIPVIGL